jgi:chromosomal replication initiation ATPase DnaA
MKTYFSKLMEFDSDVNAKDRIIYLICQHYNISQYKLLNSKYSHEMYECKIICIWLLCYNTNISKSNISKMFNLKDRTFIYSAEKSYDPKSKSKIIISMVQKYNLLKDKLKNE